MNTIMSTIMNFVVNDAHLHLIVNHFPIIFPIAGIIILIAGIVFHSEAVRRTALMMFILGAIMSIAAMVSGEAAEDIAESLSGVEEVFIEEHEEAAEQFAIVSYVLGGLALLGMWVSFKHESLARIANWVILIFALVTLYFAMQAGTSGGEIRHPEIRSDRSFSMIESSERQSSVRPELIV